ncbi:MAG: hypothetical protein KR126chlam1_00661 [Chlamydiae bacterium]|nr:hypothetical protein [Chlamydiota bacterium]
MTRKFFLSFFTLIAFCTAGFAAADAQSSVGVVNFAKCMTESKLGKQEQASFESLKTQMTSLIDDTEKQINVMAEKFNDDDYMDGLSPDAEEEMKSKFRLLNDEMNRYQNQFYQVMNQANMKLVQSMGASIQEASTKVAAEKKLTMVINDEACFFSAPTLNVTQLVITEMDKGFDKSTSKKETANNEASAFNKNAEKK